MRAKREEGEREREREEREREASLHCGRIRLARAPAHGEIGTALPKAHLHQHPMFKLSRGSPDLSMQTAEQNREIEWYCGSVSLNWCCIAVYSCAQRNLYSIKCSNAPMTIEDMAGRFCREKIHAMLEYFAVVAFLQFSPWLEYVLLTQ